MSHKLVCGMTADDIMCSVFMAECAVLGLGAEIMKALL